MSNLAQYAPGAAYGAQALKEGEMWTLLLVRELRHAPEKVWQALIEPEHLREWAPFEADGKLEAGATVNLTWVATGRVTEAQVTRAEAPRVLELQNMRWELEAIRGGTRLTLWHSIPPHYIAWGAAGWHISIDVLDRLLGGIPVGRMAGAEAAKLEGWHRLVGEYAKQFGAEPPGLARGTRS